MTESVVRDWAASPQRRGWLRACLRAPALWIVRASRRRELMALDAEQMKDCGFDPIEVRREALKPFWRE